MEHRKLSFIGAGNMTRSIIAGLLQAGYPANKIMACNRSQGALDNLKLNFGVNTSKNNDQGIAFADVVVLAVKPQMMAEMCANLALKENNNRPLFVSIAAGLTVQRLQQMLGIPADIIRVMPNTPSLIGEGMSGIYADDNITSADRQFVTDMMNAVGTSIWVDNEADINSVIAAAGSSPAYFFLFLQAMQEECIALGFDQQSARLMVQQAMLGAASLVCDNPDLELSELRAQVTSKGGTTFAAINSFKENGLKDIVSQAMQAAIKRAEEMEKQF